jgi:tetratricopeptide (TPR) repeat protein
MGKKIRVPMAEADDLRRRAIAANGEAWTLLEKTDRNQADTARMIGAAHASLAAWQAAGGPVEAQRGNWLVARVYASAGLAEPAIEYARRTMELTRQHQRDLADFDLAFAKEIAARTWALAGNLPRAKEHYDGARKLGEAIKDAGDRLEFFRQLAIGPWFGIDAT